MHKLANWLFEGGADYADGLAIYKALRINPSSNAFFDTLHPSQMQMNLLFNALRNHARVHRIRPVKLLKADPVLLVKASNSFVRPLIDKNPHINYDDLPDNLKLLYDTNGQSVNRLKSLHLKLKSLGADPALNDQRKALANEIILLDADIRSNWAAIDSWFNSGIPSGAPLPDPISDLQKDRLIKAHLNYIRRYFNRADKQPELQKRMSQLDSWNISYAEIISKVSAAR